MSDVFNEVFDAYPGLKKKSSIIVKSCKVDSGFVCELVKKILY